MSVNLGELVVILLVAILVIRPEQLPDIANKIGRGLRFLRTFLHEKNHEP